MKQKLEQRKSVKRVKGMTLIEILIAMAVFAVAGLMMVKVGAASKSQLMNSNHLNNKTQAEAAIGGKKDKDTLNTYGSTGEQDVTFTVGSYAPITAKRYDTLAADAVSGKNCDTGLGNDESLQFYIIGSGT